MESVDINDEEFQKMLKRILSEEKTKHVCGLQGFDPIKDECEACEEMWKA